MMTSLRLSILAAASATFAMTQLAGAANFVWTAGSATDLKWNTAANWSSPGIPGTADLALFGVTATTNAPGTNAIDNLVPATTAIQMLDYTNITLYHNTFLNPGVTLIISNTTGSGDAIFVGGGGSAGTSTSTNTISGPGASLVVTNPTGNINIRHGSSSSTVFNQRAALDLSGLDIFNASVARLLVAGDGGGANTNSRVTGTLFLAKTNVIVASSSTVPAINVGDNASNGSGGNNDPTTITSFIYLGQTNSIYADTITIGRQKCAGVLTFNPVFTNTGVPVVYIRGYSSSRVTNFSIGDHSALAQASNQRDSGVADFTGGKVDAQFGTVFVGRSNTGNNTGGDGRPSAIGTLTFTFGTIDINSLILGFENVSNATGIGSIGTVNVGGTGTLLVNAGMQLSFGSTTFQNPPPQGILNVGGTVSVNGPITSGGGTSIINLVGGTLNLTNAASFAGTLPSPISSVSISNTVINLAVNTGTTNIVASTLNINASSTVNIASVPVIGTFPAQFPLIAYSGVGGDPTTVTLGSMPILGGVPYKGYISNNTANLSIDLVVTNGFVPTGVDVWTGTNNANWDMTSPNWTLFGVATAFANGAIAQFDDSATGATSVNLVGTLIPSSLIVSNNTKNYTLGGSGNIAGIASLVKYGTGTLLLTNLGNNSFIGGVFVSNGTVQFGNGGSGGNLPASPAAIVDNGTLILDQSINQTVTNNITGTGNLVLSGSGVTSLTGSNNYAGQTAVTAGSGLVEGFVGGLPTSILTNAPGATIGGNGINLGVFNAAGNINPGDPSAVGTFTTAGNLTLYPGATVTVDLNSGDTTEGSAVNDLLQVGGNLTANNTTVAVNIQNGLPQIGNVYPILTYAGVFSGTFNPVVRSHFAATVDTSTPNVVNVDITGNTGAKLKWSSTSSSLWDLGISSNWFNFGTSSSDVFYAGDSVLFDDSVPGVQTSVVIPQGVIMFPAAITNISSVNSYTISGGGSISGPTALVKDGTNILTINTTNSFTGGVTILNGIVKAGTGTALGLNNLSTYTNTIANGATFDENSQNMGASTFVVSGGGVGGNGAIINSGPDQSGNTAFQNIVLAGDTTFGGPGNASGGGNSPGRWDIRGGTPTLSCMNGNPYNLTKVGSNQVSFVSVTIDPNLANITVKGGVLGIQSNVNGIGNPTNVLTLYPGALLHCAGFANALTKVFVMTNANLDSTGTGANEYDGTMFIQGTNSLSLTDPLTIGCLVSGAGGFTKSGASTLTLSASNTYTGNTVISAGTLRLNEPGAVSSANISTVTGTTIDATGRNDQTLTLLSGQTLTGAGIITGSLTNSPGATFNVGGIHAIGTNTISGGVTLQGTTYMEVTNNGVKLDGVQASGNIEYGGTLVVSNLDAVHPFAAGQSFPLFTGGGYAGAFANIVPAIPGPGLGWDTNSLTTTGTLNVISTTPQMPHITSISLSGMTLTISGTNGTVSGSYRVLASTNLAAPLNQWVPLTMTNYDSSGNFSFSTNINATLPQQYYIISQ